MNTVNVVTPDRRRTVPRKLGGQTWGEVANEAGGVPDKPIFLHGAGVVKPDSPLPVGYVDTLTVATEATGG